MNQPNFMTTKDIAAAWHKTPCHIARYCQQGRFPGAYLVGGNEKNGTGGVWCIPPEAVKKFQYKIKGRPKKEVKSG